MLLLLLACAGADDTKGPDTSVDSADTTDTVDTSETADSGGGAGPYDDAIEKAVDKDFHGLYATGASVAVWKDGAVVFAKGYGVKDPDGTDPVDPDTLFQIGSDTKKLTAIAVLRQAAAGKLDLDAPLTDVLPDLSFASDPDLASTLTLNLLMSHDSGLYDYTPWTDDPDDNALASRVYGEFASGEYAMIPPGHAWDYSNSNFALAGLAAETADGRPWGDIVEDDIFAPLGMTRSFARKADAIAAGNYAVGYGVYDFASDDPFDPFATYDYSFGRVDTADEADNAFTRPAGLVWSTASDMVRLEAFLMEGDDSILAASDLAKLTTPHVGLYPNVDASTLGYGYGLMIYSGFNFGSEWIDTPLWLHGGNTLSMTSQFYLVPGTDCGISILSNGYGDTWDNTLGELLSDYCELPAGTTAPVLLADPDGLDTYDGTYVSEALGRMTVAWDGTDVTVDLPDLVAEGHTTGTKLTPYYLDIFTVKIDGVDYEVDFTADDAGNPHGLLYDRQFGGALDPSPEAATTPRPVHWHPSPIATPGPWSVLGRR